MTLLSSCGSGRTVLTSGEVSKKYKRNTTEIISGISKSGNGKKMRKWAMTSESVSVVREDFWECECCEWRLEIVSVVRELFSECEFCVMTIESLSVVSDEFWEFECCEWWLLRVFVLGEKTFEFVCFEWWLLRVWVLWENTFENVIVCFINIYIICFYKFYYFL